MPGRTGQRGMLQIVGGWFGILGGGGMVILLACVGTILFKANAGEDWQARLDFTAENRQAYRMCWSLMIVLGAGLLPLLAALYDALKGKAPVAAALGLIFGSLASIFTMVVGIIRASSVATIAAHVHNLSGHAQVKNAMGFQYMVAEKAAFNVDTYIVGGCMAAASLCMAQAFRSVPRYPALIIYALYAVGMVCLAGMGEELFHSSSLFHWKAFDYNIFLSAGASLFPLLAVPIGARLVAGYRP